MRNLAFLKLVFLVIPIIALIPRSSAAQNAVPMLINYQGELRSPSTGQPVPDGSYNMVFRIYGVESGGTALWQGMYLDVNGNPVQVKGGTFSVVLGSGPGNALDAWVFNGADRWLQIQVRAETLLPRQRMTSVAYSMESGVSGNSRLLGGKEASDFVIQAQGLRLEPNATSPNIIAGYGGNTVTAGAVGATIAGGGASDWTNSVTDDYSTIGGGVANQAGDNAGTTRNASYATVAGSTRNIASAWEATVGGGYSNSASGAGATVGGGEKNTASGTHATVPGGIFNHAIGDDSFAAGTYASANGKGCFVWGDNNPNYIVAWNANEFIARATGGFWFITKVDTNGVALEGMMLPAGSSHWVPIGSTAAQLSPEQPDRVQALEAENASLKQRIDNLESRLVALEALMQSQGGVQK